MSTFTSVSIRIKIYWVQIYYFSWYKVMGKASTSEMPNINYTKLYPNLRWVFMNTAEILQFLGLWKFINETTRFTSRLCAIDAVYATVQFTY